MSGIMTLFFSPNPLGNYNTTKWASQKIVLKKKSGLKLDCLQASVIHGSCISTLALFVIIGEC